MRSNQGLGPVRIGINVFLHQRYYWSAGLADSQDVGRRDGLNSTGFDKLDMGKGAELMIALPKSREAGSDDDQLEVFSGGLGAHMADRFPDGFIAVGCDNYHRHFGSGGCFELIVRRLVHHEWVPMLTGPKCAGLLRQPRCSPAKA